MTIIVYNFFQKPLHFSVFLVIMNLANEGFNMTRKKHTKKKISPEHLAKLQAGRKAAQTHKKRVASAADLEARALRRGKYKRS